MSVEKKAQSSAPIAPARSGGSGASKSSPIQTRPFRAPGLRGSRKVLRATSRATGLPFRAITTSSPDAKQTEWAYALAMRAMVFDAVGTPLRLAELPRPEPAPGQVLVQVRACGVCRTDLHVVDGELSHPKLPLVPGHEVVGTIAETGREVERFRVGQRVGVPWLGATCGTCRYCRAGRENLCESARFTGYDIDGGYGEYLVTDQRYAFPLADGLSDLEAAPLLCAGLIGFRALRKAGDAKTVGLYGFGAAAHIVAQLARFEGREIFAFTRPGDRQAQSFARELGAVWAGDSDTPPPQPLDAAILFAPVGALVPAGLRAVAPRGTSGVRRHPHERDPELPLRGPVARARDRFGRQPHAGRRRGLSRTGAAGAGADDGRTVRAGRGQRGARRSSRRASPRRRGAAVRLNGQAPMRRAISAATRAVSPGGA